MAVTTRIYELLAPQDKIPMVVELAQKLGVVDALLMPPEPDGRGGARQAFLDHL